MAGVNVDIGATTTRLNRGLKQSKNSIRAWAAKVTKRIASAGLHAGQAFVRGLVRHLRRGALVAGGLIAAGIGKSISEAGRFEAYQFQFQALMGSAEKAKERMQEIRDLDLEVPFDITQLADASRVLEVFTEGAFAGADALRMIADAAAVTPRPMQEVAYWYARAYAMIKAGRPLGEANRRLMEMGVMSAQAAGELQRLSKSFSPRAQAQKLAIINREFRKFEGSAALMAKTWKGVMSVFTSATKQAFEAVGNEIMPLAKEWLQEVIDKMAELREDGTLAQWGRNVATAAKWARKNIKAMLPAIYKFVSDSKAYLEGFVKNVETLGFPEALKMVVSDAVAGAIKVLEAKLPVFIPIAVEIGMAIADGIGKGMERGLQKNWLGRRVSDIVDFTTGRSEREFETARKQERDSRQKLRDMHIAFGERLHAGMGGDVNALSDRRAMALAQQGYRDRDWASRILKVEIVNTQGGL